MRRSDDHLGSESGASTNYELVVSDFDGKTQNALVRQDLKGKNPNQVFMIRGLAKNVADLKDPAHPHNVVYIDGACRGPCFDPRRGIFSLDHHEDCIRAITLSTAVQAMRLTRKLSIGSTGFKVAGNDPDLDTVLATWAIMHADRVAFDDHAYEKLRPIVNLAGVRDTYGFGCDDFTDLSYEQVKQTRGKILWLMREAKEMEKSGRWSTANLIEYVERRFKDLDTYLLYSSEEEETVEIDYTEVIPLPNGEKILFVQAPSGGVFGAEHELVTKTKDQSCVCVVFYDGKAKWTVKLTRMVSAYDLAPVWKKLSALEMAAKEAKGVLDPSLLETGWGGSTNIGGQPRYAYGIAPFIEKSAILDTLRDELIKQQ